MVEFIFKEKHEGLFLTEEINNTLSRVHHRDFIISRIVAKHRKQPML